MTTYSIFLNENFFILTTFYLLDHFETILEIGLFGIFIHFSGKKLGEKILDVTIKGLQIGAGATVIATGVNTGFGTKLKPKSGDEKDSNNTPKPSGDSSNNSKNNNGNK